MNARHAHALALPLMAAGYLGGCVAANIAVVDQKTALEEQAAGGYPVLENDLDQAGMAPSPEPFTREELAADRARSGESALGDLAQLYVQVQTDADAIDQLLLQKCVGEALSGLLEPRPSDCIGTTDATELAHLVGRENLHRRQLWQLMASEQQVSVDRVQDTWRALHREQVVCGGLVEAKEDLWEPKTC
ncbi:MAG TPA: DUF1318 domain-containing protein [Polyangiales bacterium]|jgi:uncharacterized protein YdbL (DUF1318 family)|nr:DUF1318 domain-containing protein [Polyangiales bacterium]